MLFLVEIIIMKNMKKKFRDNKEVDVSRWSFSRRESHKVICADCKKETTVPFEPKEGRPVYCRDCLPKHRERR